jgi:hypothetical protein
MAVIKGLQSCHAQDAASSDVRRLPAIPSIVRPRAQEQFPAMTIIKVYKNGRGKYVVNGTGAYADCTAGTRSERDKAQHCQATAIVCTVE